jgi:hypothetical protein
MTVQIDMPNVFDAGLPALTYDVTETPREVYPRIRAAQDLAPVTIGPLGPEVLGYELARAVLRDNRFVIPPDLHLTAQGMSGPTSLAIEFDTPRIARAGGAIAPVGHREQTRP